MHVLMVAAENDALPDGKVGGIGDVVRDAPRALAKLGCHVDVVTPAYHRFTGSDSAELVMKYPVEFAGGTHEACLYRVAAENALKRVKHWAIELPDAYSTGTDIYFGDAPQRPFAKDATKFAFFCAAVGTAITRGEFGSIDVLHLHDWHAAFLLLLREYHPQYATLQSLRTAYTVHNLALQGIRPLDGDESCLAAWYHHLQYDVDRINDPRYPDCLNPMRVGINLADAVHVVSNVYADEILMPSDPQAGFYGGEGLEQDLQRAQEEGRLFGILNGCPYPTKGKAKESAAKLLNLIKAELERMAKADSAGTDLFARSLAQLKKCREASANKMVITSVGRITDQKVRILFEQMPSGKVAAEEMLHKLPTGGVFIMLGSGDPHFEAKLAEIAARHDNFIFINGYSETIANALYRSGDLFLMPSSFEPCGISQMIAMRHGQPCLVHRVGGLAETVTDQVNGFSFSGSSAAEQAQNMLSALEAAINIKLQTPKTWAQLCKSAAKARFTWQDSARQYIEKLYAITVSR